MTLAKVAFIVFVLGTLVHSLRRQQRRVLEAHGRARKQNLRLLRLIRWEITCYGVLAVGLLGLLTSFLLVPVRWLAQVTFIGSLAIMLAGLLGMGYCSVAKVRTSWALARGDNNGDKTG